MVESTFGKQIGLRRLVLGQQRGLRQRCGMSETHQPGGVGGCRPTGHRQHVVTPQTLVGPQQPVDLVRHRGEGSRLGIHHVAVEVGRTSHRLAGVVNDEIQPIASVDQVLTKGLHTRRMAQIETENLQSVTPLGEVGLLGVPKRRIAGKAGRHDQVGSRSEQLDAGLVADLHSATGEQRHPAGQVGRLPSLGVVEVTAGRAHLVVEGVDCRVALLADIAMEGLKAFPRFIRTSLPHRAVVDLVTWRVQRSKRVGSGEYRLGSQRPDSRLVEDALIALRLVGLALPTLGLDLASAGLDVGLIDVAGGGEEAGPLV